MADPEFTYDCFVTISPIPKGLTAHRARVALVALQADGSTRVFPDLIGQPSLKNEAGELEVSFELSQAGKRAQGCGEAAVRAEAIVREACGAPPVRHLSVEAMEN